MDPPSFRIRPVLHHSRQKNITPVFLAPPVSPSMSSPHPPTISHLASPPATLALRARLAMISNRVRGASALSSTATFVFRSAITTSSFPSATACQTSSATLVGKRQGKYRARECATQIRSGTGSGHFEGCLAWIKERLLGSCDAVACANRKNGLTCTNIAKMARTVVKAVRPRGQQLKVTP